MQLPSYWLTLPDAPLTDTTRAEFEQLWAATLAAGKNALIHYGLAAPKWQFLSYLAERHAVALHGSGNFEIQAFEPRQSNDLNDFGNRQAVYAAADGPWAMYFAVIDRERYPMTLINACIRVIEATGQAGEPRYFFSISRKALSQQPWRTGVVYLLSRATFEAEAAYPFGPIQIQTAQLASLTPVMPLARLTIAPDDFPFLARVRGHDDARLREYATALQTGAPWPDDQA